MRTSPVEQLPVNPVGRAARIHQHQAFLVLRFAFAPISVGIDKFSAAMTSPLRDLGLAPGARALARLSLDERRGSAGRS